MFFDGEIAHRYLLEADGDRDQLFNQCPSLRREVDRNGAAVILQSRARDETTPFHLPDQPRQRRYLDRRHDSEDRRAADRRFPKARPSRDTSAEGHAVAGNAPGKQLTHLHADAVEQVWKGICQSGTRSCVLPWCNFCNLPIAGRESFSRQLLHLKISLDRYLQMQLLFAEVKPPNKSGLQWRKPCRWIRHPTNCVKRSSARCGDFPRRCRSSPRPIRIAGTG